MHHGRVVAGFAPDTVVMESTGIYWKSPYAALEKVGIRARVVNAQHVKKVPGRKTDINDAEWLAMLARAGRLARQFHPAGETAQRAPHKPLPSPHYCHVGGGEKPPGAPLERCRYPPHGGRLRPPRGGSPRPDRLPARWRHAGRLTPPEELLASLQGELSEEHLFVARMIRQHIATLQTQLADLEHRLFDELKPYEAAVQLLLTIPGIDRLAAAKLLVEIGVDMTAFATPDRLSKWAGVCPGNHESAGKRKRGKTAPGNRYVRAILCEIAWAASRTTSQFKSKFQGLVIRRGTKRALIALAHKVLKTVFVLLSRQVPYRDSTVDYQVLMVKRNAPRWIRQLKKFGYLPKTA
jgi:transposase